MEIGEEITWNWHSGGGGVIKRTVKGFKVYEVPLYGGEEQFTKTVETLDEAKEICESFT